VKNIATRRLGLVAATVLVALTGCAQLRSYNEPTAGSRARVRIVGNQPLLYSHKTCDRDDMKLEGFAYFGNKRHDLHMPYPLSEAVGATEYYVVAGVNLTVTFRDGGDVPAPKGYRVIYKGADNRCKGTAVVFSPEAGHDYEVRENGGGFCSASVVELVPAASGAGRYIPVEASACPASL
jgi:hypothetical protein